MRIGLITDTHWGVRSDNIAFLDNTKKFLDNIFFPYLDKHQIDTVIHLGDLLDRRKYTNSHTAYRMREDYIDPIRARKLDYHQILGNHDCFFKNTNRVNAVREFCGDYQVYDSAQEVIFDDTKILLVPWICQENRNETYDAINKTQASICLGHLELEGFQMYRDSVATHGDDRKMFDKFDLTCSGHYHHRSSDGSIFYLGSHAQFTWSDYGDSRGFHVLDTEKRELTFIENPYKMFEKVVYDDTDTTLANLLEIDFELYKNTICKVIVKNKNNPYWFDMFCERIEKTGVTDMQIVDDHLNMSTIEDSEITTSAENTWDIFKNYIRQINTTSISPEKLEKKMEDLYIKASNL